MKKNLLLFLSLLVLSITTAFAQLGVGQQFPNNNFEQWRNETSSRRAPVSWNSINSGTGGYLTMAAKDFVAESSASPGGSGSSCVQLTCVGIKVLFLNIPANGGLTNGRFNAGATTADDPANCTYTSTAEGYHTHLTSYPDSLYVWTKTSISNNEHKARFNVVIHTDQLNQGKSAIYQDPEGSDMVGNSPYTNSSKEVANATLNFRSQNTWTLQKVAFNYNHGNGDRVPAYVLATFSTNMTAGTGTSGDKLWFDDVVLIYNTRLEYLNVNGQLIAGFNPDVLNYNLDLCQGADFPPITFDKQSQHATATCTHTATVSEPYTEIKVTHRNQESDDNVSKVYRINFNIISTDAPTFASSTINKCEGIPVQITPTDENIASCKWYTQSAGGEAFFTGKTYTCQSNSTVTYYVSSVHNTCGESQTRTPITVNVTPIPAAPSLSNADRCGAGEVTLSVENPNNDYTYTWKQGNNTVNTGSSYTPNLSSTTTYSVTASQNGCASSAASVTATINNIPSNPTSQDASRCGAGELTLEANPGPAGTCQWFAAAEGGDPLNEGNSYSPSLNATTTYYIHTYISNTGCHSSRIPVVASIYDVPAAPVMAAAQSVCPGSNITLSVSNPSESYTYNWYSPVSAESIHTGTSYTIEGILQETSLMVKAVSEHNCLSAGTEITAQVNELPNNPNAIGASVCYGETVTLNAFIDEGMEARWYNVEEGGESLSSQANYSPANLTVGNHTFYVSQYNTTTGCEGLRTSVVATVKAIPTQPTVDAVARCGEGPVTLSVGNVPPAQAPTYQWFATAEDGQVLNEGSSYTVQSLAATTTYYVQAVLEGCTSARTSVVATVNAIPDAPMAQNVARCGNGNVVLNAEPAANCVCKWFDSQDVAIESGLSNDNKTLTTSSLQAGNYTYKVKSYNETTGCYSDAKVIEVVVSPNPGTPVVFTKSRCGAGDVELTAQPGNNANNCRWYNANNELLATATNYTAQALEATTAYKVSSYNTETGCESGKSNVTATINAVPAIPSVSGNDPLCGPGARSLTATPGANATTCRWILGNDTTSGNNFNTNNLQQSTTYQVQSYNANTKCASENVEVTVVVNEIPATPEVVSDTVCYGNQIALRAVATEGNVCRWFDQPQGVFPIYTGTEYQPENLAIGTTTFYVGQQNTETGCASASVPVYAVVKAVPEAPTTQGTAICGAGNATLSVVPQPVQNEYYWYETAEGQDIVGQGLDLNLNMVNFTSTYYVEAAYQGCVSGRTSATVVVNFVPAKPEVSGDTILCAGNATTLTATSDEVADHFTWHFFQQQIEGAEYTTPELSQSTYCYVVAENTATNCVSEITLVNITVNQRPADPTVANVSRCGVGNATLAVEQPGENVTYKWYNANQDSVGVGVQFEAQNVEATSNFTVVAFSAEGCQSVGNGAAQIVINAVPANPELNGVVLCEAGNAILNVNNPNNNYTYNWYEAEQGGEAVNQGNSYNTMISVSPTTYYVSATTAEGCVSEGRTAVTATIQGNPSAPVMEDASICGNGKVTLTVSEPNPNYTYNWYTEAQGGEATQGTSLQTATLSAGQSVSYFVSVSMGYCESERTMVTAYAYPVPGAPTASGKNRCGAGEITMTAVAGDNANTCRWYNANSELQYTGLDYVIDNLAATTQFAVASYNEQTGCESSRRNVTATINPIPEVPSVTGNDPLCGSGARTLTATPGANATICRWFEGADAISSNTYQTENLMQTTSYQVQSYNANTMCASENVEVTVVVNEIPAAPEVISDTVCEGNQITLNAVATDGNTCRWFGQPQGVFPAHTGNQYQPENLPMGTTTLYVDQQNDETGCASSRVPVYARINAVYHVNVPVVACDEYTWNNETFTESDNYERTLTTVDGCDSVVTLQLTINHSKETHIDTTVCDEFVWNGVSYTESEPLSHHFFTTNNCDSAVYINLTVKHSSQFQDHIFLCSNELPYNYHDLKQIEAAGPYEIHTTNAEGCDSTIYLTVTVNTQPATANVTPAARCGEGNVTLNAQTGSNGATCRWYASQDDENPIFEGNQFSINNLNTTTTYYVSSYNDYNGHSCESARQEVTATINEIPALPHVEDQYRCGDGLVEFSTYYQDGISYRWYLTSNANKPVSTDDDYSANVCVANGTTSFYVESVNMTNGCKSARIEVLATAYPVPATPSFQPLSSCGPDEFNIDAPTSGEYYWFSSLDPMDKVMNVGTSTGWVEESTTFYISNGVSYDNIGCESERGELVVTIYPVYEPQTIFDTICQGVTYNNHGINETFNQPGEHERVINEYSTNQCDSLVTLALTVKEIRTYEFTEVACDSYEWNGEIFTQSDNNIVRSFTSSIGCDSIVTLHLTINHSVQTSFEASACDSYTWNDKTYTESGIYVDTLSTRNGCDSTVTLHLTIYNSVTTEFSKIACDSYTWNDATYTQSNDYVQHFQTIHGCDSTVTLHLTVNYSDNIQLEDVVCAGTRYNNHGFDTTITAANTYELVHHNFNAKGCDSTTTLTLTVNPSYNRTVNMTICETALPFTWADTTYLVGTPSGEYEHTFYGQTALACDSIVTLNLTISNKYITRLNEDICGGESYQFAGEVLTETGVYSDTLLAVNMCDSIVILTLTVHDLDTTYLQATICEGEDYIANGISIIRPQAGHYVNDYHTTTAFGCDSTIFLDLTVNPRFYNEEEASVCDNEEYVWDNHNVVIGQKAAGTYVIWDSLKTVNNCDSVYKLTLNVTPTYYFEENANVCDNEAYVWAGHNVQIGVLEAGTHIIWDSLQTVNDCDSVYKLTLNVTPTYYFEENGTSCDNEAYVWAGHNVQIGVLEAGTHIIWDSLQTATFGCDSVYKLTLNVNPSYYHNEEATICASEEYIWQGHNVTIGQKAAGTHIIWDSLKTANACDSVYKLTLNVTPTYYFEENGTSCDNEPYVWAGHNVQIGVLEAGEYVIWDSLQTAAFGCDSVYKLNLTINPTKQSEFTVSICEGEVYQYNNRNYSVSDDYVIPFKTSLLCDSIVTLHLIVNPVYDIDTMINVCQGAMPYWFGDTVFETAGTKTVTMHTQNGCDSIYNVTLMVTPFITASESVTICSTEVPYHYKDSVFYTSGTYEVVETSADGCNKITTLTLTVNPTYNITVVDTACGEYVLNRITHLVTYTESGIYVDTLSTRNGCDSIVTYDLTIYPEKETTLTLAICEGESYTNNGFNIITPQAGLVLDTLHLTCAGTGCDSTVYLELTVNPSYNLTIDTTVCNEFVWNDSTYTESDILTHTYTLPTSCDSTVTINLTVNHSYHTVIDTTVCDQFICPWILTHAITESQVLTDTFPAANGCDSIVTINLTVNHSVQEVEQLSICQSELPYTWRDTIFGTETTVDMHTVIFNKQTVNGCDSIVTLYLNVRPNNIHYENPVAFCQGESYTWNGQVITETGVYTDTVDNDYGCYDVYVLNVTVHPTYSFNEYDTICSNELPYAWRGLQVTHAGTTEKNYTTAVYGCDSTYVLNLTVNPTKETTLTPVICEGESYTENGFNIITPQAGLVLDTLYTTCNTTGCDSTVYLQLTVNPTYNLNFEAVICQGERYQENGFDTLPETAGTHVIVNSLRTAADCDSIRTLTLTVNPIYNITVIDTACGEYVINRITHLETYTETGIYVDTLSTINGCDSIVTYDLTIYPEMETTLTLAICEGESYTNNGFNIITPQAGLVLDTLHTTCVATGCDSTVYLELTVNPSYNLTIDTTVCDEFVWNGITYTESEILTHTYTLPTSCDSTVTINLTVNHSYHTVIDTTVCDQFICPWILTHAITETQILTNTFPAANGCDSIVTINLTVNHSVQEDEQLSICQSELPYAWRDTIFGVETAVGMQTVIFNRQTVNDCDSTVTLYLNVNPNNHYEDDPYVMCQGETYDWRNMTITESGIYTDTVANDMNCYDVYSVEVTVNPTYRFNEYDTICDNELPYAWRGLTLNAAGEREVSYFTINGCDSIYHLYLTVTPTYLFTETDEICSNESLTWHNQTIENLDAGTYTYWDSLATVRGCDSVYKLTLKVNPVYYYEETASMCSNGTYVWEGHNRTFENLEPNATYIYWDSLQTASGCDSVYKLSLLVNPAYSFAEEAVVCENETYVWEGHDVQISWNEAGTYTFTDHQYTATQCDSIYVLTLTVNPTARYTEEASSCSNEDVYEWHGMELTATGVYYDTLATVHGCDSVCEMHYTLLNPTTATFADTTCANAEYSGYGFELSNLTPGDTTVQRVIDNMAGCDSTITLNLYVKPLTYSSFDVVACEGYLWNNSYYTESGQYQQTFGGANDCDSIVTLNLVIDHPVSDTTEVTSCNFYEWDGTMYYQSGIYQKIYQRPVGCDSTAVLNLTINHSTEANISDTICLGEFYDRYGFDTLALHVGMMPLQRTDVNAAGCDSVIRVNLLVRMTYLTIDTVNSCDNQPYQWQGMTCDTTGIYTKIYPTVDGCDSIFILALRVYPTYEMDAEDTAYVGVPYQNHGLDFTPQSEGTMNVPITFASINGCDSTINLTLVIVNGTSINQVKAIEKEINLYPNPTDNRFTVTSTSQINDLVVFDNSGKAVLFRTVNDNTAVVEVDALASGIYYVRLNTVDGIVHKKLIVRK